MRAIGRRSKSKGPTTKKNTVIERKKIRGIYTWKAAVLKRDWILTWYFPHKYCLSLREKADFECFNGWFILKLSKKKKKKQCNKEGPDEFYLGKCLFKQWQKHQLDIAVYTEMQSFLHVIRHLWKIFGFSEVRGDFAVGFDRTLSSECGGLRLWQWLQLLQPIPAPSRCAWGSAADKRRASQICPQYCI